jgi:radical SAM superfamily enzyme with C-terminal helix-hairpin-helix motif
LNTATRDQILAIPNTGNRMVREFEEYRPYTSIVQFRREIGKYVDEAQVAEYEKYVYVPVSPNNADAATLQQLPGVTADVAAQLIAARPFASKDAFVAKLSELTSAEQANAASAFVDVQ